MRFEVPGIAASLGIAVGTAHVIARVGGVTRRRVSDRDAEVERLRSAIDASRAEIESAKESLAGAGETGLVLDAQLLMHRDELLVDGAAQRIRSEGMGAEWAIEATVADLKAPLEASSSRYFRERAQDIEHVGQHILRHLRGKHDRLALPESSVVLVASDLSPADAVRLLGDHRVLGLVTEVGSSTSHTALLARALEVPAVVGAGPLVDRVVASVDVIVDGLRGRVVLDPRDEERDYAEKRGRRFRRFSSELRSKADEPATTLDGAEVTLMANIELPVEAIAARAHGARGIGLYRTEFLFLERDAPPEENEQVGVYRSVLEACADRPVVIRTFDLGGDKLPRSMQHSAGPNPALGLRAVRLMMREPEVMRSQVRAALRAAAHGPVELMFPMVEGPSTFRTLRGLVAAWQAELDAEGVEHGEVRLGAMVEVPSAALLAKELATEADFLSVGTNDLVQYTLAVDRSNADVAALGDPLHPAVVRLLAHIVQCADKVGTPVVMCGDMAADPIALPVVLGLGYRRLSVPTVSLPFAQELVRRVDASQLTALATEVLDLESAVASRAHVRAQLEDTLGSLWSEQGV
ncbi:MAG: phosphoenolpyruvate--protein phosphotransferase [Myxococcota bacterium]